MTYDNIKSRKKQGFTLSLESDFLKKTKEGGRGGGSVLTIKEEKRSL